MTKTTMMITIFPAGHLCNSRLHRDLQTNKLLRLLHRRLPELKMPVILTCHGYTPKVGWYKLLRWTYFTSNIDPQEGQAPIRFWGELLWKGVSDIICVFKHFMLRIIHIKIIISYGGTEEKFIDSWWKIYWWIWRFVSAAFVRTSLTVSATRSEAGKHFDKR